MPDATASQHPTSCNEDREWSRKKRRVARRDERLSRPLGEPCHWYGGDRVPGLSHIRSKNTKCQSTLTFVRRGGPLRSTTAELIRVKRHALPDAHWRPTGHPLHAVRLPVIPTRPVQLAHRHQMPGQVLRQPRPLQLPFPILGGGRQRT